MSIGAVAEDWVAALRVKVPGIRWVVEGGEERGWNPKSAVKPLHAHVHVEVASQASVFYLNTASRNVW